MSEVESIVKEVKEIKGNIAKALDELIKRNAELEKRVERLEKVLKVERAIRKAQSRLIKRLITRGGVVRLGKRTAVDKPAIKVESNEDVKKRIEELKKKLAERKAKSAETPRPATDVKHPEDSPESLVGKLLKGEVKLDDLIKKYRG